jgi:hypothetical protein
MGLDQYAYSAAKANARDEWLEERYERGNKDAPDPTTELAYWRKHPNLQGWMEQLWNEKGRPGVEQYSTNADVMFNGVELELTWDDIEALEQAILSKQLPQTKGFFFGEDSDEYYRDKDLEFVKTAKVEIFMGHRVFYNSSW